MLWRPGVVSRSSASPAAVHPLADTALAVDEENHCSSGVGVAGTL